MITTVDFIDARRAIRRSLARFPEWIATLSVLPIRIRSRTSRDRSLSQPSNAADAAIIASQVESP
jgi:hypothetical protein